MTPRLTLAVLFVAAACATFPGRSSGAETGAAAVAAVDRSLLLDAADVAYTRDLDRARAKGTLDTDRGQLGDLRRLLQPLLYGVRALRPIANDWSWAINIETHDEPIGYCLPGGKLLVTTGLVSRLKLTPVEQGAVLAHLIAHALDEHDATEALARFAREGGAAGGDPNRTVVKLAGILADVAATAPHGVAGERAADALALELMARSGVDPRAAVEAWRKVARAGGAAPPGFAALHPSWPERLAELEARMPAAVELYEARLRERKPAPKSVPLPIMRGRG